METETFEKGDKVIVVAGHYPPIGMIGEVKKAYEGAMLIDFPDLNDSLILVSTDRLVFVPDEEEQVENLTSPLVSNLTFFSEKISVSPMETLDTSRRLRGLLCNIMDEMKLAIPVENEIDATAMVVDQMYENDRRSEVLARKILTFLRIKNG